MFDIKSEFLGASAVRSIKVTEFLPAEAETFMRRILANFTMLESWPKWLWEHLSDCDTHISSDGWRLIQHAPGQVVVFFNQCDDKTFFLVERGVEVEQILEDCTGFEVYFTDPNVSFLLIHNHHDCIFACGSARVWSNVRLE